MIIIDEKGTLMKRFSDPSKLIPAAHLKLVCKIGTTEVGCRYAGSTLDGWICAKNTEAKKLIDENVANGVFKKNTADNCEGF